jgi:DNA-binding NarL/FixJ family response regulator
MKHWRVLLVDDQSLFRSGIAALLSTKPEMQVVGQAGNGREAIEKARALHPDLILMDIQMPEMNGLEATRQIKAEMPETCIVILTALDDDADALQAILCGAQGYLLKSLKSDVFFDLLTGLMREEVTAPLAKSTQKNESVPTKIG